ncbi:MAG: regulator [Euryarchaeota archaeon]|nr:regulator [Euryarchaeota archaeon]
MWDTLIDYFRRYPAQEKIARLLIQYGLRIQDDGVYCGPIRIADSAIARAAGVDRRIVAATIETITAHHELRRAFARFRPTLHLKDAAPELGWGVLEIVPENASTPGILAGVSSAIAMEGISIRQAIVDDPDFIEEPKLFVVTEQQVPARLIPEIQAVEGVRSVTVY